MAGRTVLITGASSGIGRRFALKLGQAGARVAVCARRTSLLTDLVHEIEAGGGKALAVSMDVGDEASVIAGFDEAQAKFGLVESVIANAGVNNEGLATELTAEDFDHVMSINVKGVFLTAREGARRMMAAGVRETGRGRIVLIASIGAHTILAGAAAYCASKAAVLMMGKALAREWVSRGINVNIVCPGYIRTEINQDWFDSDSGKKQISRFLRKRLMDVGDMDEVVQFLCSDASRAVTGSVFTIDDGQSLGAP